MKLGTQIGVQREATIVGFDDTTGIVKIALDEGNLYGNSSHFNVPLSATWIGPNGEFMGGGPVIGQTVVVQQGQGGQWYIQNSIKSNQSYSNNSMSSLKPGRALIQVKNNNLLFVDPNVGTQVGNHKNFLHINPNLNIISHNFKEELSFTESGRSLDQVVKRDLVENSSRNLLGATLNSQLYDLSLTKIGMDPTISVGIDTKGSSIRNPSLVEKRSITYEFADTFSFTNDIDEYFRYLDPLNKEKSLLSSKKQMRSDTLSLSLSHPNHLIESIQGTAVDSVGNILDLNRNPLPIGKNDNFSLKNNSNKAEAFSKIRELHRKSIAFHWEMNVRKSITSEGPQGVPDPNNKTDYAKSRSKFFIDVDKEGQFKINVPASSETGNIGLLTRYENYSVLLSKEDESVNPNSLVRNEEKRDIFLEGFSNSGISLISSDNEAHVPALDRFTQEPIKLGTAFHDITKVLSEFQESAGFRQVGKKLIDFNETHPLNTTDIPYSHLVTNEVIVSGPNANAGGRSGTLNFDGMLSLSIGANTIDRQSLWLDTAGAMIGRFGRDKQGVSIGASLDGDFLMQIGGPGIGNNADSRFIDLNDAYRNGKLDIRVLANGQNHIVRIDETGIHVISAGRMTFSSQQTMVFRSNSNMTFEAENIVMYSETSKRGINRFPKTSI